jgi:electron transport complex protein RnfG
MVLTVIAAVSAGVLAFISQKTEEPIANALLEEKMSAVRNVLPPFDNEPDKDTLVLRPEGEDSVEFYRGRKDGVIVGAAFAAVAPNGYSGEIEIMIGVDTAGVVQGIEILRHLETPGLGAKIETAAFRDKYRGKSLKNPEQWDVEKDGGTFKQITGATISSRAVTHCIARALELFDAHQAEILGQAEPEEKAGGKSDCGAGEDEKGGAAKESGSKGEKKNEESE